MKIYPDVDQNCSDYHRELARHVDCPHRLRVFEVLWSGTQQYQKFIERDGFEAAQQLYARIKADIVQAKSRVTTTFAVRNATASQVEEVKEKIRQLGEPEYRRNPYTNQLEEVDNSARIAQLIREGSALRSSQDSLAIEEDAYRRAVQGWESAEKRLAVALLNYYREHATRLNHKVRGEDEIADGEPRAVRVVAMPARETTTSIARDDEGNIVASTQIEKDKAP